LADGTTIDIVNKLSYLTNGKSTTGYHALRQTHLKKSQEKLVLIDYIDVVDIWKESTSDNNFDAKL